MKQVFQKFTFRQGTLDMIQRCNVVIDDLRGQGYTLTLRQLYYQLVSRDIIANKQTEYKRLGSVLNDARLAGLVDWDAIEDRTRNLRSPNAWDTPEQVLSACAYQYKQDRWKNQPNRVEVWVEKDALVGVVQKACNPLNVPFFSCRGYTSQSELYGAGRRLRSYFVNHRQKPIIIHLGDHDPSGIDMTRDISDRLRMFAGFRVEVRRIALNMPQIEEFQPPPNPAKETDARFAGYQAEHGDESWELDALAPSVLEGLIRAKVLKFRDADKLKEVLTEEAEERGTLKAISSNWDEVSEWTRDQFPDDARPDEIDVDDEDDADADDEDDSDESDE